MGLGAILAILAILHHINLLSMCIFKPRIYTYSHHQSPELVAIVLGPPVFRIFRQPKNLEPVSRVKNQWDPMHCQEHGRQLIGGVPNFQLIIQLDHLSNIRVPRSRITAAGGTLVDPICLLEYSWNVGLTTREGILGLKF